MISGDCKKYLLELLEYIKAKDIPEVIVTSEPLNYHGPHGPLIQLHFYLPNEKITIRPDFEINGKEIQMGTIITKAWDWK